MEHIAAIYVRQSIEKEDSCSLEMQELRCRALADVLGLPAKVYADPGKSGKDLDRPGFKMMMADVRAGKVETVIVYKLDRISRNLKDFFVLMDELQSLGVGFRSITENFDTTTPIGRATLGILAVFAQFERETTAQRVRDNMLDRARLGLWNGGPLPYGYTAVKTEVSLGNKTKEVSVLEIDEERAEVVRKMFRDFLEGKGIRTIARELNTTSVTPARGTWTDQSVRRILQNPVYCAADQDAYGYFASIGTETMCLKEEWNGATGIVVYNRRGPSGKTYKNNTAAKWIVSVGRHRPLVDGKSFVAVQKKLTAHALPPRTATGKRGLLVGLARCGSCGRAMSISFSKKSKRDNFAYMYYMCPGKGHGTCEGVRVRADKAEVLVVDALIQITTDPDWEQKLDAALEEEISTQQIDLQEKLIALTRQIEGLRSEEKNLIVALGRGTIKPSLIESRLREIEEEQKLKMSEMEAVQTAVRESGVRQVNIEFVRENLHRFRKEIFEEMSFEEKRALLRSLIERVEFYPDKLVVRVFIVGGLGSNGCPCDAKPPTIKFVQAFKQDIPEGNWPGAVLARARTKAGLTIKELSKRTGVSELTISAWERNVNRPQVTSFAKVASYLGVPIDTLGPVSFLKAARARLRLTQKKLGRVLGVSRFRIQEWEAGRRKIPAGTLAKIRFLLAEADGGPGERAQASL